jgi:hypothetical protein
MALRRRLCCRETGCTPDRTSREAGTRKHSKHCAHRSIHVQPKHSRVPVFSHRRTTGKKNNYKPDEKRKMLALTTYLLVVILARSRYAIGGEDCT